MEFPLAFDLYSQRYCSFTSALSAESSYQIYLDKFSFKPLISTLLDLYVTRSYKWIEQLKNGYFCTINIKKPVIIDDLEKKYYKRTYPLVENDLFLHLKNEKTIGVFPNTHTSKFLIFDVDTVDFNVVRDIYFCLSHYFYEDQINISFSGKKGYHISLFFKEEIDRAKLQLFFNYVLLELKLDESIVECRGGMSEMAVKIPLGYNYAAPKNQNGETFFVDSWGQRLNNDYIFNINKISSDEFFEVLELNNLFFNTSNKFEVKKLKKEIKKEKVVSYALSQQEFIQQSKKKGISAKGQRHKVMFQIAISLRDEGLSQAEAREYLAEWHKLIPDDLISSSEDEILKDIKHTVKNVYNNYQYCLQKDKFITFSKLEIEEILSVKDSVLRRVYFALFCQAKSLGIQGNFSMSYSQMAEAGTSKNRARVREQLLQLQEMGKIKIVAMDRIKKMVDRDNMFDIKEIKYPNVYKLLCFQEKMINEDNVKYKIGIENLSKNFLDFVAKKVFIPAELNKFYNKNQLTKIKKLDEFVEIKKLELDALELNEINSVEDIQLKVLYLALILNCKYDRVKSVNIFDFSGFYRTFGIQKNKSMSDYIKLLKQLETLGKIKILNYSRFFFKYELVKFKEVKVNVKEDIEDLEKYRS